MDDPDSPSSSEEELQNNNLNNPWHIDPEKEKIFWKQHIFNNFVYPPKRCPVCLKNTFKIYEKKNEHN